MSEEGERTRNGPAPRDERNLTRMQERPIAPADLDLILQHTEPLWDEMRNQRLFITGGTGFFGSWILSSFIHANHALGLNAVRMAARPTPSSTLSLTPAGRTFPRFQAVAAANRQK